MIERLWAGWRLPYVAAGPEVRLPPQTGASLFETIEQSELPDAETYVLWRGFTCFALLNLFPYTNGHLMVLPKRAVATLAELTADEHHELWETVRDAVAALGAAYAPDGFNVGLNLGEGAGAGVPDHLHVHVLPRWRGDTNFTVTVAETKVLPEALDTTWQKLRAAWPEP